MKRGTPEHPKTMELAEAVQGYLADAGARLSFDMCQTLACGLLERLHHFTARYAPAGDIGKHSNLRIANAIGWTLDAPWIIATLAEKKLIDTELNGVRLYVHDWHDHSDDAADKWLYEKGLRYANGHATRRGKKSRPSLDPVATQSRQSESKSESDPEPKSDPESDPVSFAGDTELRDWLIWWNTLKACGLVAAAVNVDEPSQGAIAGWKRVQKSKSLRALLIDRDAIRREIEASSICRRGWFDFAKLCGGKNRDGEVVISKLLAGGYRDYSQPVSRQGAGQNYDPAAAEKDAQHGTF